MHINLLLCDTFPGLLPVYIPSYASMFVKLFDAADPQATYRVYRVMDGELPSTISLGELYLITGCNQSAYDDIPWIKELLRWIASVATQDIKLVGICFGHQVLAQALRGKVEKAAAGWGIGIRESRIIDPYTQKFFPGHTLRLLYNHHDQVVSLPPDATLISTSAFCPIESFRIGTRILTFQGHPEYVPEYETHLLDNFSEEEQEEVKAKARASIASMRHQGEAVARFILQWTRHGCI